MARQSPSPAVLTSVFGTCGVPSTMGRPASIATSSARSSFSTRRTSLYGGLSSSPRRRAGSPPVR
eukprot:3422137-Lingulodinium_polyedra.AAC.1